MVRTPPSRTARPTISRKSYEKRGVSKKEAESRAWATVNKQDKGGKNDGSRPLAQPQRRRQEGLGDPPPPRQRLRPKLAFEDFDRALDRAQLAVRESLEPAARAPSRCAAGSRAASRPDFGQPQREPAAVVGSGVALDQPGADQGVDRAADRRGAAPDRGGDLVEGRGLVARRSPRAACAGRARRARPGRRRPNSARRC